MLTTEVWSPLLTLYLTPFPAPAASNFTVNFEDLTILVITMVIVYYGAPNLVQVSYGHYLQLSQ